MSFLREKRDLHVLQLFYPLRHLFMMRNNWSAEPKIYLFLRLKNFITWSTLVIAIHHLLI